MFSDKAFFTTMAN